MKAYVCDSCKATITDPYEMKMKEFYIGCGVEGYCFFPVKKTQLVRIHLCEQCYSGLAKIAQQKGKERWKSE